MGFSDRVANLDITPVLGELTRRNTAPKQELEDHVLSLGKKNGWIKAGVFHVDTDAPPGSRVYITRKGVSRFMAFTQGREDHPSIVEWYLSRTGHTKSEQAQTPEAIYGGVTPEAAREAELIGPREAVAYERIQAIAEEFANILAIRETPYNPSFGWFDAVDLSVQTRPGSTHVSADVYIDMDQLTADVRASRGHEVSKTEALEELAEGLEFCFAKDAEAAIRTLRMRGVDFDPLTMNENDMVRLYPVFANAFGDTEGRRHAMFAEFARNSPYAQYFE